MGGYVVSLNKNTLRVSLDTESGVIAVDKNLPEEVAKEGNILDVAGFSQELGNLLLEGFGKEKKRSDLNFLVQQKDTILKFITLSKSAEDVEESLIKAAKEKLAEENTNPDHIYYSMQKIAPFVYQLVGVKKEVLDNYAQVATTLNLNLASVVPWIVLLPKVTQKNGEPTIFMLDINSEKILALSELNGVYHAGRFTDVSEVEELKGIVEKLSIYGRKDPITKVSTLNLGNLGLGADYKVDQLPIDTEGSVPGFEPHLIFYFAAKTYDVIGSQSNVTVLLPRDESSGKVSPMIYASALAGFLLIVGTAFAGFQLVKSNGLGSEPEVLPENDTAIEEVIEEPVEEVVELKKEDLVVRIENGTFTSGLAGSTSTILEEAGYDVSGGVGDAVEDDVGATILRFKEGKEGYEEMLKEDLAEEFGAFEVEITLDVEAEYDVQIILGSD